MFAWPLAEGLELRLLEHPHAEALFSLTNRNREYLREWLPWVDATLSVLDTSRHIEDSLGRFANNDGFAAGIWRQGELAGMIALHKIDRPNRSSSIGYWLSAERQGKGLMTTACRAVIDYAFSELELNRIEIRCGAGNRKSRAIPERLGFRQEGVLRQAEWVGRRFVDLVVYAMLAAEWHTSGPSG